MIRFTDVTREYRAPPWRGTGGRVRALEGVSLEVSPGTALGLIGPNGAGKSTLLKLLLGYLRPTSGEVLIGGTPPRRYVERHGVGYLPEEVTIPGHWTVRGTLDAFAALGEVAEPRARVAACMDSFALEPLARRRVGALSRGNRQKLAIAQALLGDRKLLVLDEPLNGLDPVWVARLREILQAWRAEDPERVLLVVSHNLAELERAVEHAAVLVDGKIRAVLEVGGAAGPSLEARLLALLEEPQ
jgi:ABC-type multidrug transport system ATPase subunit